MYILIWLLSQPDFTHHWDSSSTDMFAVYIDHWETYFLGTGLLNGESVWCQYKISRGISCQWSEVPWMVYRGLYNMLTVWNILGADMEL